MVHTVQHAGGISNGAAVHAATAAGDNHTQVPPTAVTAAETKQQQQHERGLTRSADRKSRQPKQQQVDARQTSPAGKQADREHAPSHSGRRQLSAPDGSAEQRKDASNSTAPSGGHGLPHAQAARASPSSGANGTASGGSHIVPFPGRDKPPPSSSSSSSSEGSQGGRQGQHETQSRRSLRRQVLPVAPLKFYDDGLPDTRPIVLFDMNGTLTSHTAKRRSVGANKPRPGTEHLRRLVNHFRVGVFTSATIRTVQFAIDMLEEAAGQGPPIFDRGCILYRDHTLPVPHLESHMETGGKAWDTIKPLHLFFRRLHRVVIVDDDEFKAAPGEENNMLLVPRWEGNNPEDKMVPHIVDALLSLAERVGSDPDADLRPHTRQASKALAAIAGQPARQPTAPAGAVLV